MKKIGIERTVRSIEEAGAMNQDQIRKTVEMYVSKEGRSVVLFSTDAMMSVAQKSTMELPAVNENDVLTRIVSVNRLEHKGSPVTVISYTGTLTSAGAKLAAMLAPTCASIRGGYFPGHAALAEVKTQIGGIDVPDHWKNVVVLHKKNALLFSSGKTLQEIGIADVLKQNWSAAKIVANQFNSHILFIGRPSENEKDVFVVTESSIITVDISNYRNWKELKAQPRTISAKTIAFFKEGRTFISLLNNNEIEVSTGAAAA